MKTRMLRDWKPWMSFTASSFFCVAPAMATKPGMRPSTSLMPCWRRMLSPVKPSQMPFSTVPLTYLRLSMTSSASRVATPESRVSPR